MRFLCSFSCVFFLLVILGFAPNFFAKAAEGNALLLWSPAVGTYQAGEEFAVDVLLHTEEFITSVKAYVQYDPQLLAIQEIIEEDQQFPYWWEQEGVNGTVRLQASTPLPGAQGELKLARLIFQARQAGTATLWFDPSSLVLTPQDENILEVISSSKAQFTLLPGAFPRGIFLVSNPLLISVFLLAILGAAVVLVVIKKKKPSIDG